MRTKWLMLALPLIILGVLAQSAFWVPTYESQAQGNPERLVTFLRPILGDPKQLNPITASEATSSEIMENNVSEGLLTDGGSLKVVPRLAESWELSEEAYLAVLPDRKLPDGSAVTAQGLTAFLRAAWRDGKLAALGSSIQSIELCAEETRALHETVLVDNAKGKKEPASVELTLRVPARVKFRLAKVEQRLFQELAQLLGPGYFEGYPFADHFELAKPQLLPEIREKFPQLLPIGEHNPIITFHLRAGVRWHDGQPFTADDVKFTYQALTDPKNTSPRAGSFDQIKSVEVLDPLTARVVYKRLYAQGLLDWMLEIEPKHLLDSAALEREMVAARLSPQARKSFSMRTSSYSRHPVGTGPFRFAEWRSDQFIHLTRNDDYWGPKAEYRDVYFRTIPDYLTTELEFQAGALDWYDALPHQAARYRKNPDYHVVAKSSGYYTYIAYNLRRPLFRDVRVRRALGMALDVSSIIRYALFGEGKRASGPYYSNTPYNDPAVKPLAYDPKAALALLAEAGWKKNARGMLEKDGKPFQFTLVTNNGNPQRKAIMTVAQESWQKLGIDCKIQAFEWTVFIEDFVHKLNFDAVVLAWVGGDINPDKFQLWHSSQTHPYQLNYTGFSSPRADELITGIQEEYDYDKQVQLARELHRVVAAAQPYTFLYEPLQPVVLDKRVVQVERLADGREIYQKVEPTPSGALDNITFYRWRKQATVPEFAQ
jgi:ABC-type transport system substrate-binding protein